MKGEERYLLYLFNGASTRFVIPVYQRNYDWKKEQCSQLFSDLEELVTTGSESHFFGSIVSQANDGANVIIDGQQRITTSFLLLLALVHSLRADKVASTNKNLADMLYEEYLIDKWNQKDSKLKLKLIKNDQAAFELLFDANESKFIQDSNVTQNYLYFRHRIEKMAITADQLANAIGKLQVIDIRLNQSDDAQRIFESLNSTGLGLSEGDKIRNFILMGLPLKEQEECYESYWNPIEENTDYNVSAFARAWLTAVRRRTPSLNSVYTVFKDYVNKSPLQHKALLEKLRESSDHYHAILKADSGDSATNIILRRLALLDATITHPFLLNLFEYRDDGKITNAEVVSCLTVLESYLFRRWVCRIPTNALNKVFETLHWEAVRGVTEGGAYPEVLKRILLSKEGSGRFPRDDEYLSAFEARDFYHIGGQRFYLYDRLENGDSKEMINVVKNLRDDVFSIEHIMPQTLSKAWMADLGPNYEDIHNRWLHKMANLTLTAYNSSYSNRRFSEKVTMKNGFKESAFRINQFVYEQESWGEDQLIERQELLRKKFLELWPMATSTFEWAAPAHEEHSLGEDFDYTGHKIAAYSFMGTRFTTKSWVEMILGVLAQVHELNPVVMLKYVPEGTPFPGRYFFGSDGDYRFRIGEGVYYNPGNTTLNKIETLKHVFDEAGIEQNELSFELYGSDD